ncbi:hypothetical protein L1049_027581 [Liquidambar formosana]|uniref:Uncharacterized protein n=1 Tax=Liquidambar formosana TaxID=63359 RepID=A0AAP0RHN2_LIQFO
MAQQKMHCAPRRTYSNTERVSARGEGSLSRKSLENKMGASLEDCEVSSLPWNNTDHRCAFLKIFTFEPDGHLGLVVLPIQCPNHSNNLGSRAQMKMDGLYPVSQPSSSSFKVDKPKVQRRNRPDGSCSVKCFAVRSFSGSNLQCCSRNKAFGNKDTKSNEFSENFSRQNLLNCSDLSGLVPSSSNATSSSDVSTDKSKVVKAVKKNSRKKARNKGKQNKKLSCDTGSTGLEVFSEECANGSLPSETCGNDMVHADFPGYRVNGNDFEGDDNSTCNSTLNSFALLNACPSVIDEVDVSEAILTSSVEEKFTGEHPTVNSENGVQTNDPGFSFFNGRVEDTHCKQIGCCEDMSYEAFSDTHNSLVLDSVSVAWNSDDNTSAAYDPRIESNGTNLSEAPGYSVKKGNFSYQNLLNGFVDSYNHAEGTKCGSQGCSSSGMQLVVSRKRGKQVKTLTRNSSVHRISSVGNSHGHTGKENNHSVWQKVQRNDAKKCNCESKKVNPVCSQFDVTLKEAALLKRNCNVVESDALSKTEDKSHLKFKVSRKLKRKTSLGSKQEYNCYSGKGSHALKASSNVYTKINMQQGRLDIPDQANDKKGSGSVSRSHSQIGCQKVESHTKKVESSEQVHGLQVCTDELELLEGVCDTASTMNDQTTKNHNNSFSKPCNSLDQSNLLEAQSPVCLPPLIGKEVAEVEKGISVAEHSKQDHGSGSTLQKWIPVGIKDLGLTSSRRSDGASLVHSDEVAAEAWISKSIVEEDLASSSHNLVPSVNAGVACMGQSSRNVSSSSPGDESKIQKLRYQNTCAHKEKNSAVNCLDHELKDKNIPVFETISNKISQAVNDARKVQLESEAFQVATGSPIAEFERILHSVSPIICHSNKAISCQTCSRDQVIAESLCRHETPKISLGSLWQWYEKHGSYGLEIRAEEYESSKRLGVDQVAFRAYFVPSLSAVQLFRSRKCSPSAGVLSPLASEACEMGEKYSNVGHLPIFSILVPQPRTNNTSLVPLVSQVSNSERSSVSAKDVSVQSVDTTGFDDLELLFEYFEYEQPQQRRPLFEKIKELVRGGPSQCKAYGDPTTLVSIDLHDLHPRSWYSVAWYPIYRIPDGNFRAAFLTYHSLGHLVRRSATSDSHCVDACIVSPVVGLQSYNAQGECWFQPRHSTVNQTAETLSSNTCGILKERLRTLEQTASLIARASVSKGNLTSVNRHPDFEFFLSRRR